VSATVFVGPGMAIALLCGAAARAHLRRNAGKLSWRRAAFKEEVTQGFFFDRSDRTIIMMIENCNFWWMALALPGELRQG